MTAAVFDVTPDSSDARVVLRDGDDLYEFLRKPHSDVVPMGLDTAVRTRGTNAFNPCTVGLGETVATSSLADPWSVFELAREGNPTVLVPETIRGISVWRVQSQRTISVAEYWIEELSF